MWPKRRYITVNLRCETSQKRNEKSLVSIYANHPMQTAAGMRLSHKPSSNCIIRDVRGLRRWHRVVWFRCCLLPPASKWENITNMGEQNPPISTNICGRQLGVTPLTMVSLRLHCLLQTAIDRTDNTKYYDVIKNRRDFHKLRPFARIFSL